MTKFLQISLLVVVGFVFTTNHARGQDQQYTQFYANPMYLSPAFAGTSIQSRIAMSYRNQWPAIPKAFVSYNVAFDHFVSQANSGVALTVSLRPALSLGFGSYFLDVDKLTFMDQLARDDDGATTLDPDRSRFVQEPVNYPDFGAGILVYSEAFWFGASIHHINEPIQSLTGSDTQLPKKMGVHGGVRFKLSDVSAFRSRQYIVPAFNYQMQGMFDQLDLGFYYEYDPVVIGLWYRGIPLLKSNGYNYMNHDAIAVLVGYQINNIKIGYSYDLTVSKFSPNSGGAHELTLTMEFASKQNKKRSKRRVMPCAKF